MKEGVFPHFRAVCFVMAGTIVYAFIFASSKLTNGAVSLGPIMFLRYFGSVLTLVAFMYLNKMTMNSIRSRRPTLHLLRAVFAVLGVGSVIYAASKMPILDATAISMLHVLGSIILGTVILGERLSVRTAAGAAISAAGAAAVLVSGGAFSGSTSVSLLPVLIALGAALFFALDGFLLKVASGIESPLSALAYMNVFALVLTLGPCIFWWNDASVSTILLLVAFGPLALGAQYLMFRGYVTAPLSVVAPIDYSLMGASCLVGLAFFGEVPTWGSIAGSAMIATGAFIVAVTRHKPVAH